MASQQRLFERVAILGLGLMGGSLGLALHERGVAGTVAGYDAVDGRAELAQARGAIDEACAGVETAVRGADLVVLAVPVLATPALFGAIRSYLEPNAVVTDLGSVKWFVCEWAAELPRPERFVGGHPMAGSEQSGVEAANSGLFEGVTWCLTPTDRTDPDALRALIDLVTRMAAVPYTLDPRTHDRLVAGISHVPMLAASALVRALADRPEWEAMMDLAASGFRDSTRLASGDPVMARDIAIANAGQIVGQLDAYIRALRRLRAQVAGGDGEGIQRELEAARDAREAWLRRRGQP